MHLNTNNSKILELSLDYALVYVLVSVIAAVEQQSQHVVVPEAVMKGSGEHRVVDHSEITVHLSSVGKQQLHQLIPRLGG